MFASIVESWWNKDHANVASPLGVEDWLVAARQECFAPGGGCGVEGNVVE